MCVLRGYGGVGFGEVVSGNATAQKGVRMNCRITCYFTIPQRVNILRNEFGPYINNYVIKGLLKKLLSQTGKGDMKKIIDGCFFIPSKKIMINGPIIKRPVVYKGIIYDGGREYIIDNQNIFNFDAIISENVLSVISNLKGFKIASLFYANTGK